jgi:hypothetical protein
MKTTAFVLAFILALLCGNTSAPQTALAIDSYTTTADSAEALSAENISVCPSDIAEQGFGASEIMTVFTNVKNDSDQRRNVVLICAFYQNKQILKVECANQTILAGSEALVGKTLKTPKDVEGVVMKVVVLADESISPMLNKPFTLYPKEPYYSLRR